MIRRGVLLLCQVCVDYKVFYHENGVGVLLLFGGGIAVFVVGYLFLSLAHGLSGYRHTRYRLVTIVSLGTSWKFPPYHTVVGETSYTL